MKNKYWVKYCITEIIVREDFVCPPFKSKENYSEFVTTGLGEEFPDLESWWVAESDSHYEYELLEVVKL